MPTSDPRPLEPETPSLVDYARVQLERMVDSFEPGTQLPSEGVLATDLGVSRATVREAVTLLQARGLVRRRQGRGTFVERPLAPPLPAVLEANLSITEMIARVGSKPGTADVAVTSGRPDVQFPDPLRYDLSGDALVVRRVRTADERPVVYSVDFMPADTGLPTSEDSYRGSLYELLAQHYGHPVSAALACIRPETASDDVAGRLGIPLGDLLVVLYQRHELSDGRTVLYSVDYLRSDVLTLFVRRRSGDLSEAQE